MTLWRRVDARVFEVFWLIVRSAWTMRIAILLAALACLFFAGAVFGQSDVQRQIDRLEREINRLQQSDVEQQRIRQIGFERLASLETSLKVIAGQVGRLENALFGSIAGLLANFLASLKTIADLRTIRKESTT